MPLPLIFRPRGGSCSAAIVAAVLTVSTVRAQQFGPPSAKPDLPPPGATKSVRNSPQVLGWREGKMPTAPAGFRVSLFADLPNARWIYQLPNGDVLVSQADSSRITLLRDADGDGKPELVEPFLTGLKKPFGMLLLGGNTLYIGETHRLARYPYQTGQTRMEASSGVKILDLPAGGYNNHWTRNVVARPDGKKLLVTVGSGSNVAEHGIEHEARRAGILEINPDGSGERVFASGLRNPVGIDFAPGSGTPWTVVNERDNLGDELVPDYLTSVKDGGFYGWPYAYFGQNEDPRRKGERPDLVAKSLKPDYALGSHTASLGLVFYRGNSFPEKYRGGAFIGQRGSWNHSSLVGYKVVFVPFDGGKPSGPPQDFLTGFIADVNRSQVYGRPVGVAVLKDGSLLVADEPGGKVWRVSAAGR